MKQLKRYRKEKQLCKAGAAKRVLSALLLCVCVLSFSAIASLPASAATSVRVTVSGKEVVKNKARIIDSTTYVPFRAFADDVTENGTVTWRASTRTATLKTGSTTVTATVGRRGLTKNGVAISSTMPNRLVGGTLYVPVRPIATALGYSVSWNNKTYTAVLTKKSASGGSSSSGSSSSGSSSSGSSSSGTTSGGSTSTYSESDLYWLSRIIEAEAGGEPYRGKLAVGTVVMNRVKSKSYPNTIYGVIFDKRYGVQFTPAYNGRIYKKPSAASVAAAKEILNGYRVSGNLLYFMNPSLASSAWFDRNLRYVCTIGSHRFYAA